MAPRTRAKCVECTGFEGPKPARGTLQHRRARLEFGRNLVHMRATTRSMTGRASPGPSTSVSSTLRARGTDVRPKPTSPPMHWAVPPTGPPNRVGPAHMYPTDQGDHPCRALRPCLHDHLSAPSLRTMVMRNTCIYGTPIRSDIVAHAGTARPSSQIRLRQLYLSSLGRTLSSCW